jgi:hypothetical protein
LAMKINSRVAALRAVAEQVRRNADFFVTQGGRILDSASRARHVQYIRALANELDTLADDPPDGLSGYRQFEEILDELYHAGFCPQSSLISEVGRAFAAHKETADD